MSSHDEIQHYRNQISQLGKRVRDRQRFEQDRFIDSVTLPLNQEIKVCDGFFAKCVFHGDDYDVIEVRFEAGFTLPRNKHDQRETIVLINGILENGIWSAEAEERRIIVLKKDGLHSYEIKSGVEHSHHGVEPGKFVSVITPPINQIQKES